MKKRNILLARQSVGWGSRVAAVAGKDMVCEFRTRYAFNAIVLFALVTLTAVSFSVGALYPSEEIMAAIFWIILFFASMSGLAHTFVKEEESGTAMILRLSADGMVIFWGKLIFNFILVTAITVLIVPLFVIFLDVSIGNWVIFAAGLVLGLIGLSGATTIVAAIVSRASVKGALFTVLSFPVLMPLLMAGIEITKVGFIGGGWSEVSAPLQLLAAYDVVMITISVLLFDFVWRA